MEKKKLKEDHDEDYKSDSNELIDGLGIEKEVQCIEEIFEI